MKPVKLNTPCQWGQSCRFLAAGLCVHLIHDGAATASTPSTAPPCQWGSACRFLASGTCKFSHPNVNVPSSAPAPPLAHAQNPIHFVVPPPLPMPLPNGVMPPFMMTMPQPGMFVLPPNTRACDICNMLFAPRESYHRRCQACLELHGVCASLGASV